MDETLNEIQSKTEVNPESWTQLKGSLQYLVPVIPISLSTRKRYG